MKLICLALASAQLACTGAVIEAESGSAGGSTSSGTTFIPTTTAPYRIVVTTGQSLGSGEGGLPVVSTAQLYQNRKLHDASAPDVYGGYDGDGDELSLVPLVAPLRDFYPNPALPYVYPVNAPHETLGIGMCNQLAAIGGEQCIETNVAETTHGMDYLVKGGLGNAYAATLYEVSAIVAIAAAEGRSAEVIAVVLEHGQTDSNDPAYAERAAGLQADYDADLRAITGQEAIVPMLISPQNSQNNGDLGPSYSTLAPWQLAARYPERFVVPGPKYQFGYSSDNVHLDAPGYRRLGEQAARALLAHRVGAPASLQAVSAAVVGTTVTIDFAVPAPPLAWSGSLAPPHQAGWPEWSAGRGFEVRDDAGPVVITGAEIAGASVVLTLAAPPGPGGVVSYGLYQDELGFHGGDAVGRHGLLCDSEAFVGYSARSIACNVTQGSATVTAAAPGDFWDRGRLERASSAGLEADVVVVGVEGDTVALSAPWNGPSGSALITFRNDHRNYAVQFALAL